MLGVAVHDGDPSGTKKRHHMKSFDVIKRLPLLLGIFFILGYGGILLILNQDPGGSCNPPGIFLVIIPWDLLLNPFLDTHKEFFSIFFYGFIFIVNPLILFGFVYLFTAYIQKLRKKKR